MSTDQIAERTVAAYGIHSSIYTRQIVTYTVTAHHSDSPKTNITAPICRAVIITSTIAKKNMDNMANHARNGNDAPPLPPDGDAAPPGQLRQENRFWLIDL